VLRIPAVELARIAAHATAADPEEACGFLLGTARGDNGDVFVARAAANVLPSGRAHAFRIAAREVLEADAAAARASLALLGFYHSHPLSHAEPSGHDAAAAWPGCWHLILAVADGAPGEAACWWRPEAGGPLQRAPMMVVQSIGSTGTGPGGRRALESCLPGVGAARAFK
jgi:proteasome lid subunit RPN8/RPN11